MNFIQQQSNKIAKSFNTDPVLDELRKMEILEIEKGGRRAQIGEKRIFGGREYIKTPDGWKFHGKGTGAKAQEHAKHEQSNSNKDAYDSDMTDEELNERFVAKTKKNESSEDQGRELTTKEKQILKRKVYGKGRNAQFDYSKIGHEDLEEIVDWAYEKVGSNLGITYAGLGEGTKGIVSFIDRSDGEDSEAFKRESTQLADLIEQQLEDFDKKSKSNSEDKVTNEQRAIRNLDDKEYDDAHVEGKSGKKSEEDAKKKGIGNRPGMISLETIAKRMPKKQLYDAVNKRFGTSFKEGSIDEFEDDDMRTQLTADDIISIIKEEKSDSQKSTVKYGDKNYKPESAEQLRKDIKEKYAKATLAIQKQIFIDAKARFFPEETKDQSTSPGSQKKWDIKKMTDKEIDQRLEELKEAGPSLSNAVGKLQDALMEEKETRILDNKNKGKNLSLEDAPVKDDKQRIKKAYDTLGVGSFFFEGDVVEKAHKMTWKQFTNEHGTTYQKRVREKIDGSQDSTYEERKKRFETSPSLTQLSDKLSFAQYYNGKFYLDTDDGGVKELKISDRILNEYGDIIDDLYGEATQHKAFGRAFSRATIEARGGDISDRKLVEGEHKAFLKRREKIIAYEDTIAKENEAIDNEMSKYRKVVEKRYDENQEKKNAVDEASKMLKKITKDSNVKNIQNALYLAQVKINGDPIVEVTFNNKTSNMSFSDLVERIKAANRDVDYNKSKPLGITLKFKEGSIENAVKYLTIDDYVNMHRSRIINKVRKQQESKK